MLPVAKKYGACVLGLTLDDSGIPQTAEERFAVAQKIVSRAESIGIPRENVLIDCLTLTASAQQELVQETLKAVRMVRERLGVKTVLGVSNVSFGLPRRPLVNRTMLAAALACGLDAAIMNPGEKNMAETIAAWRVLSGEDADALAKDVGFRLGSDALYLITQPVRFSTTLADGSVQEYANPLTVTVYYRDLPDAVLSLLL